MEVQDKLHREIVQVLAQERQEMKQMEGEELKITLDILKKMRYLDAVVLESLRLFPPADMNAKECIATDTLPNGATVPKGTVLIYDTL